MMRPPCNLGGRDCGHAQLAEEEMSPSCARHLLKTPQAVRE